MKDTLISFVGTNDANKEKDGAILTIFKDPKFKFDDVQLLWNPSEFINYFEVAKYVKSEIIKRKYCKTVVINSFECEDVTDHNEIYPKLLSFCKNIKSQNNNSEFTAAIASGTPSMQVCWILLAESGDFPLKLIRSDDPKFGRKFVREVKLDTSLPKILRLNDENKKLKRDFLPNVKLNVASAELKIGDIFVDLSPIEFSYYRYFLERAYQEKEYLRVDIDSTPDEFYLSIIKNHRESFPQADSNRIFSEKNKSITSQTFRSNVSKLNKKIVLALKEDISRFFMIESEGKKFKKKYGISINREKIKLNTYKK